MNCPHCGADAGENPGRFCDACGLSMRGTAREDPDQKKAPADEDEPTRCPACGTPARPPLCPACYTRISASDD